MSAAARFLRREAALRGPGPSSMPPGLVHGPYQRLQCDVGELWLSAGDMVMREFISMRGTWEAEEGRLLRKLLFPGARFLDVGANVGYFSLLAARAAPGVRVDSVEPYPPTVDILRFNLWTNGVDATVWPVALDVRRRALSISAAENNVGDARVSTGGGDVVVADYVIPAVSGDEVFAGRTFDVVKLDVQGWELEVLTGMTGVLQASPSIQIVAEYWPGALRSREIDPRERLARYREMGFGILTCRGDELEDLPDGEILQRCDAAGPDGQVNLLLRWG